MYFHAHMGQAMNRITASLLYIQQNKLRIKFDHLSKSLAQCPTMSCLQEKSPLEDGQHS